MKVSLIGSLSLRERGPDRLVLALPAGHRVVFGLLTALAVFILCSGVLFEGEPTVLLPRNTVAGFLVLVMAFGLVYEDRWTFDRAAGRVDNRFGTLFLARRSGFPMADLERIGVDRFTRGRLIEEAPDRTAAPGGSFLAGTLRPRRRWTQPRIVRLVAVDRTGEVHVLDVGPAHRQMQFRSRGLRIAGFCGVRFEDGIAGADATV
ncbi:MAG: hypothetical protein A2177_13235 [Spirochaetes bacterium RBG_13_68_11]|nr:MAG: hypothetical protein A2177_13235 [Spirochaetes bacterium RBG_13_68_11]